MVERKSEPLDVADLVPVSAPDGLKVYELLSASGGSMAVFELAPGLVGRAVEHAELDELWYFTAGAGQLWRADDQEERVDDVAAGVCVCIPRNTRFQVRATGAEPLTAVAVTMPPWPGAEAARVVPGRWRATEDAL